WRGTLRCRDWRRAWQPAHAGGAGDLVEAVERCAERLGIRDWRFGIGDWRSRFECPFNLQSLLSNHHIPLIDLVKRTLAYREGGDTMNVMVRDERGHIVVAVTTSGIAWKYPGRVGDSPVVGAGLYVDDRYGAAACMGLGEITIRQGSALRAVLGMRAGMSMAEAGCATVRDMLPLCWEVAPAIGNTFNSPAWVRMMMMDADGNVGGYCTHEGFKFKLQCVDEDQPRLVECEWVKA
ncbi:MAG: isoaspartyl peptidase/L-asparaginase, partial [Chloroflexi bacterium]|nr:isoaspartyl peptidase/L-asparaginase [Chloroflexota bacterium]